jgi:hypothetical protein
MDGRNGDIPHGVSNHAIETTSVAPSYRHSRLSAVAVRSQNA